MLSVKRGSATQNIERREGALRIAVLTNWLWTIFVTACLGFSLAAVAATEVKVVLQGAGAPKSLVAASSKKAHTKKSQLSCDLPDASKNLSSAQFESQNTDRSCLVSLKTTDEVGIKTSFSFVDVRSPEEYDRFRIAGSINIPLHLVRTKEFLKHQSIVLVNDGRSTTELQKTCGELKQSGFDHVTVLEGGLFAWRNDMRALEGDPVEQLKLNHMSVEELFQERARSDLSVINVSTPEKYKDISAWMPENTTAIPMKAKGDVFARIASVILQYRKHNPQGRLLLVADDNETYDRIDTQLKKIGVASGVLRLDGGLKSYREHVAKQQALWSQENQPKRYEACRG